MLPELVRGDTNHRVGFSGGSGADRDLHKPGGGPYEPHYSIQLDVGFKKRETDCFNTWFFYRVVEQDGGLYKLNSLKHLLFSHIRVQSFL